MILANTNSIECENEVKYIWGKNGALLMTCNLTAEVYTDMNQG